MQMKYFTELVCLIIFIGIMSGTYFGEDGLEIGNFGADDIIIMDIMHMWRRVEVQRERFEVQMLMLFNHQNKYCRFFSSFICFLTYKQMS